MDFIEVSAYLLQKWAHHNRTKLVVVQNQDQRLKKRKVPMTTFSRDIVALSRTRSETEVCSAEEHVEININTNCQHFIERFDYGFS